MRTAYCSSCQRPCGLAADGRTITCPSGCRRWSVVERDPNAPLPRRTAPRVVTPRPVTPPPGWPTACAACHGPIPPRPPGTVGRYPKLCPDCRRPGKRAKYSRTRSVA